MKSICTFIQNASWVFLTKKEFRIDQGKMDRDSTHEKPPHWSPEEGLRLCLWPYPGRWARGWEGAREAVARDDLCLLWWRGAPAGWAALCEKPFGPSVCVPMLLKGPVGAEERGMAAGLLARLLCLSLTLMAKQPGAHSPSLSAQDIRPSPFPDMSLTSSSLPKLSCILLPVAIWLRVLMSSGLGTAHTRSLCSCDQLYTTSLLPWRSWRRGGALLCPTNPLAQTQLVPMLPLFPVSPFPSPTCVASSL